MGPFFPFVILGFLGSVLPLALVVFLVVAVLGGRYEEDPDRERPRAIYLASACFVGVVTVIASVFMLVTAILGLTSDSDSFVGASDSVRITAQAPQFDEDGNLIEDGEFAQDEPFEEPQFEEREFDSAFADDEDNADISAAVMGGIVLLIALGILAFHDPRLTRLVAISRGPAARVYVKYLYLLCFVAVLVVLGAGAFALYSLYGVAAPGVAQVGSRGDALRGFASAVSLVVTAGLIFMIHWRRADALVVERGVTEPGFGAAPPAPRTRPPAPPAPEPPAPPSPTRGRIRRAAPPPTE